MAPLCYMHFLHLHNKPARWGLLLSFHSSGIWGPEMPSICPQILGTAGKWQSQDSGSGLCTGEEFEMVQARIMLKQILDPNSWNPQILVISKAPVPWHRGRQDRGLVCASEPSPGPGTKLGLFLNSACWLIVGLQSHPSLDRQNAKLLNWVVWDSLC